MEPLSTCEVNFCNCFDSGRIVPFFTIYHVKLLLLPEAIELKEQITEKRLDLVPVYVSLLLPGAETLNKLADVVVPSTLVGVFTPPKGVLAGFDMYIFPAATSSF